MVRDLKQALLSAQNTIELFNQSHCTEVEQLKVQIQKLEQEKSELIQRNIQLQELLHIREKNW